MADHTKESLKVIQPYGRGDYFNGCEKRKVSTIVEIPGDLTERFINVLDARDASGRVNSRILDERL